MATGVLRSLRERLTGRIVWGCRPYVRKLLDAMPWRDEVLLGEAPPGFETALLLTPSFRSALAARMAGIPRRIGLAANARGWLLTDRVMPFGEPVYMGRLYREIARPLLGDGAPLPMALVPAAEDEARAGAVFRELDVPEGRAVGLVPGASYGSSKCWPPAHFAALARLVKAGTGLPAMLLYGPGEEEVVQEVLAGAEGAAVMIGPEKADLGTLPSVMRRLAAVVTNDTGPRHIAEALGVPVVALVGPMDPRYTDSGNPAVHVLREPVECAPCNLRECPLDHRCLTRIAPERVMGELRARLP